MSWVAAARIGAGVCREDMRMNVDRSADDPIARTAAQFATTHWSVVLAAGDSASLESHAALERLCQQYWFPLYAFVRRKGYSPEDAQDLTQSFFESMFERHAFGRADPHRGRFRTFLLNGLQNHLRMELRARVAQRRGGGAPILSWDALRPEDQYRALFVETLTPEEVFLRRWAMTLFEAVFDKLREEFIQGGKGRLFDQLREHLWATKKMVSYDELARELGIPAGSLRMTVHRLRLRYRQLLRAEVAQTVVEPSEVDAELRYLIGILAE
jgi:RNA polymerase sigma factor (sigma-70 family)